MSDDQLFREALAALQSGDLERARVTAEKAVDSRPDHGGAQHLLGLAYCRQGDVVRGLGHLEEAAKLDRSNPHFRVMLVRALIDTGRPDDALKWALPPTAAAPGAAMLWHARAEAADAAGQPEIAAEAWRNCAAQDPSDWRAPSNAANALAKLGRWPEAAAALARVVELNPAELPLRRNYVSALGQSGQMKQAAEAVEQLLAADPTDGAARMLYAKALSELGRHQDSLVQYDLAVGGALALDSAQPGAALLELGRRPLAGSDDEPPFDLKLLRSVAALLERTNRIDALHGFLQAAAAAGLPENVFANSRAGLALRKGDAEQARTILLTKEDEGDSVYHYRLLAKVEERRGDAAAAFAASVLMNRAVEDYALWRAKAADYRATVRANRANAEQSIGGIRPLATGARRSPAFLVGFPRSGTTLLDTFLMGHPETAVLEEVHMVGAAETRLGGTTRLDHRSTAELEAARTAYFKELDRHVDPAFDGLVIDKLPLNMLALPFIYAMFPDAKIIFAQRHPCDCVLSCFMQSFVLNEAMANFLEIEDAADFYDAVLDQFTFTRANLPLAVRDLVYEQLVEDSEAALRPLIDFLGLDWDPALLDHQATASARGAIITPSYDQVVKPLDRAPSGRWLRYRDQLEPVLPVLLPWADALGYPLP